jgi:Ca-activated chloride channel family protein
MSALFESLTGLALLDPWMLFLALFVPLILWVRRARGAPAVRFGPSAFLDHGSRLADQAPEGTGLSPGQRDLPGSWRIRLLPLPQMLKVLGLLLVVVALARPVHREPLPFETEGIDILLCLDISSSMTANDMDRRRTRLDVAKDAAAQFITGRPGDRIGLICFAGYPDLFCPPTLDHDALKALLSEVTTVISDSPEGATGIGTAVARAAQVLSHSEAKSRVVILLTDGAENVATERTPDEIAPVHAAQLCEELDVRVYTIAAGIGNPDPSGNWIELDTDQVERLAERTGGRFFEARDAGAVAGVYAFIDALEKVELEEPRYKVDEGFLPFLIAALALLLSSRGLESTMLEVLP